MTAPAKTPLYWDYGTSDEGYPPAQGGPWLIDDFVSTAGTFRDWMVEGDDLPIAVWPICRYETAGVGKIGFGLKGVEGEITLSMDSSGWVLAVAHIGGSEVFRGYIDNIWEQCDIWPAGATPSREDDGPGQIGKHRTWVGLSTTAWPQLLNLAKGLEAIIFEVDDAKLRARAALGEGA